jgi:hypothetical protein
MWICSSVATSIIFALGIYAVRREQRRGSPATVVGHRVIITASVGPAVIGLTNPTILLPEWINQLSARQHEMVIAHELQHVRARDEWLIGAAICLLIVLPWNAALWWLVKRLRLAIELDCDRRVLRAEFDANEYGQVLIDVASRRTYDTAVVPALIESTSALEKRIRTMVRSHATYDKALIAALSLASLTICASAVALDPPATRPWTQHVATDAVDGVPLVLSPADELQEQWRSLVQVIQHFEPGALTADRSRTSFVFIAIDTDGRVVRHYAELRPSWQATTIPKDKLDAMFNDFVGDPTGEAPVFLQLSLPAKQFGMNPAVVLLGVDPKGKPADMAAPAIDMSAIRRDRNWQEAFLITKTDNERAMIELADSSAIAAGLRKGTELWIALTADGEFIRGGRRKIIADPNESRRFVEKALSTMHVGDVVRGTAVRDAAGNRLAVTWHWMQK